MELTYRIIDEPGGHDTAILEFFRANDHEFYPPIAARRELTAFVQSIYEDLGKYILCYDGDKIVGLTTIIAKHPEFLYYYQYVAIDKDYRHTGIATKLYEMVTKVCKEQGALRAIVKTWSLNKPSQAMFPKVGFYHGAIKEDDRDKGVHSYFYFRSFSRHRFQQPITKLCVVGNGISVVNFTRILWSLTKDTPDGSGALPYVVISDQGVSAATDLGEFIAERLPRGVSQVLFADLTTYKRISAGGVTDGVEFPDMLAIARSVIDVQDKQWLVAGTDAATLAAVYELKNLVVPSEAQQARMDEITKEITGGLITVGYYKAELADMARVSGCKGLLLAGLELHSMFGFDRQYNGVELFDPLIELAFIIQNIRIGRNQD